MANTEFSLRDINTNLLNQFPAIVRLPKVAAPYTTIVNRAQVTDFSADGLPRMGVDRVMTTSLIEAPNEVGPSGERVYKVLNDVHDQVRFVGSWSILNDQNGQRPQSTSNSAFVEITFYGTGLNVLRYNDSGNRSFSYTVDGGSSSSITGAASDVIVSQKYGMNTVTNIVSGLSLGLHTVKLTPTNSVLPVYGFEVISSSSSLVLPTTTTLSGSSRRYSTASTTSYNSGFESGTLGTKGGHVVVYQKADGSIAKAITPASTSPSYTSSADHTNEEISRIYHWREFGCGGTNDFSLANGGPFNKAFTLDDGITTLVGSQIDVAVSIGDLLRLGTGAGFVTITFVGTGLDWICREDAAGTRDTLSLAVDGVSQGNLPGGAAVAAERIEKIVSGLPYGTHTVKISLSSVGTVRTSVKQFIVYAPKTPTLPAGAVALADYFIMADYSPTATYGNANVVSPGVLRKMLVRETFFSGTWAIASLDTSFASAFNIRSNTAASYIELTFVGTGIEYRPYLSNAAYNLTFQIDGAAPTTSTFTYSGSGLTYTPGTGVLSGTVSGSVSYAGGLWSVSGLTFGVHRLRITFNSSGDFLYADAFNVITPIHAPREIGPARLQNVSMVGSCGVRDLRNFGEQLVAPQKAWAQAVGVTGGPTVTSASDIPMVDMSLTVKTSGNPLFVTFDCILTNNTVGQTTDVSLFVDGVYVAYTRRQSMPATSGYRSNVSFSWVAPVAAGNHKVDVYWAVSGGTGTTIGANRVLSAQEI